LQLVSTIPSISDVSSGARQRDGRIFAPRPAPPESHPNTPPYALVYKFSPIPGKFADFPVFPPTTVVKTGILLPIIHVYNSEPHKRLIPLHSLLSILNLSCAQTIYLENVSIT
jgi:hypothetical protein